MDIPTLASFVSYCPLTGNFTWLERPKSAFKGENQASADRWNSRFSGKCVQATDFGSGYLKFVICGKRINAHRLAWALSYGVWPSGQIDHVDGDRTNNRLSNLRVVSPQGNSRNKKVYKSSRSGITGVAWHSKSNRWHARIGIEGKVLHLGVFPTIELAIVARQNAERTYGFHENHGRR